MSTALTPGFAVGFIIMDIQSLISLHLSYTHDWHIKIIIHNKFQLLPASLRSATLLKEEGFFTSQSASLTAYGSGRKHSFLPALATNVPPACLLNASRSLKGEPKRTRANTIRPYCERVRITPPVPVGGDYQPLTQKRTPSRALLQFVEESP